MCLSNQNSSQKNIGFSDLNDDCKISILEMFYFRDLLEMTMVDTNLRDLANYIIKRKIASKPTRMMDVIGDTNILAYESSEEINVKNFDQAETIIRSFGPHIKQLDLDYYNSVYNEEVREIIRLANVNCNALTELKLHSHIGDLMEEWKQPFEKVENVTLCGPLRVIGGEKITLNELFPRMRFCGVSSSENI